MLATTLVGLFILQKNNRPLQAKSIFKDVLYIPSKENIQAELLSNYWFYVGRLLLLMLLSKYQEKSTFWWRNKWKWYLFEFCHVFNQYNGCTLVLNFNYFWMVTNLFFSEFLKFLVVGCCMFCLFFTLCYLICMLLFL